jgi:hypothetical protein
VVQAVKAGRLVCWLPLGLVVTELVQVPGVVAALGMVVVVVG